MLFGSSSATILFRESQMLLVILILRTLQNHKKKMKGSPFFYFLVYCWGSLFKLESPSCLIISLCWLFLSFTCYYIYPNNVSGILSRLLGHFRFYYIFINILYLMVEGNMILYSTLNCIVLHDFAYYKKL